MHERTRDDGRAFRPTYSFAVAALAVALTFGMIAAAPAAAQTLVNGNFEGSPQTNGYTTVAAANFIDAAQSWKVALGSVNVGTGPAATACSNASGHCIDLNGNSRGRIEQVVTIAAGSKCSVTFMMSRHLQLAGSSATLTTFANNIATSPANFTHNAGGLTAANGQWQSQSFAFVAAGPTTTLAFESSLEGAAGPQVDDVRLSCALPNPTGSLTVAKVVVNTTGGPAPIPGMFSMVTHCSANAATPGVNTPVMVPGNGSVTPASQFAAGSQCSVTETLPAPIPKLEACKGRGATWTVSYSPPVTIVSGSTPVLTVTNTLTCDPPTGGVLQVHKTVVNTLGVPSPMSFPMMATCSGMAPMPLSVSANQTVPVGGQIPAGTVCNVTETPPPQVKDVKACPSGTASWVVTTPGPQTIQLAATTGIIITNTLTCDKPTATGSLVVVKSVSNPAGVSIPATFPIKVSCKPGSASDQSFALAQGLPGHVINGIAAPSQCYVDEGSLPPIAGCKWSTAYSPAQTVAITANTLATVIVRNSLECDKPTGSLKVMKSVSNSTGGPVALPPTFAMNVTCTPSGPANQGIAVAQGPAGTTINGIAAPSLCTVTEPPLAPITHAEGCKGGSASWSTMISPAQPVAITANGTAMVTVRNTLKCDPPADTNCASPTQTTIGCRVSVNVKRTKGPLIYSVTASPAATTPSPNIAPSTSSSCAIGAAAMINQTMCWFNYNTNPQSVTLTAVSSGGALPAGFSWSGACSGSNATCVVTVTQTPLMVVANFP